MKVLQRMKDSHPVLLLVIKISAILVIAIVLFALLGNSSPSDLLAPFNRSILYTTYWLQNIVKLLWLIAIALVVFSIYILSIYYLCKWVYKITGSVVATVAMFVLPYLVFIPVLAIRSVKMADGVYAKTEKENWILAACVLGAFGPLLVFSTISAIISAL